MLNYDYVSYGDVKSQSYKVYIVRDCDNVFTYTIISFVFKYCITIYSILLQLLTIKSKRYRERRELTQF